jgi:hypothetical protein
MRAVVGGLVGSYPLGGMTYHYVQYVLGLKALGWDVAYMEDTGKWFYDPERQTFSSDPSYNVDYLSGVMTEFGIGHQWCLRDLDDRWHGPLAGEAPRFVADADVFLNISGACWLRPEYRRCPKVVYVDTDPGYTQRAVTQVIAGDAPRDIERKVNRLADHDVHATYAENIGEEDCSIPVGPFAWIPTRQPIVLDLWPLRPRPSVMSFTTVLSWEPYGPQPAGDKTSLGKQSEIERVLDLPSDSDATMELAISGPAPEDLLLAHGWRTRPAWDVSASPRAYQDYIADSGAEFSVVKDVYAKSNSGWFSERTACYLASGRPAVLQDTGFSRWLPVGQGLHSFRDCEEASAGIRRVIRDYANECERARTLAEQYFDAQRVLGHLLRAARL